MNIAVFADVHGRVALAFDLCARWQEETGQSIDLILQAGDLGAFPDQSHLDSATKRYAHRDQTELGFSANFTARRPEIAALLSKTSAPLIFVRGNHEDHTWLDTLEAAATGPIFPVDVYNRVFCLRTGWPYRFEASGETITIMGIGRVGRRSRPNAVNLAHIQDYEVNQLERVLSSPVDILLTHDISHGYFGDDTGMEEARILLDTQQPADHFFGHVGAVRPPRLDSNGVTLTCKLADLAWAPNSRIEPGAFGLLHWVSPSDHTFEIIDAPWLDRYNRYTWKYQ